MFLDLFLYTEKLKCESKLPHTECWKRFQLGSTDAEACPEIRYSDFVFKAENAVQNNRSFSCNRGDEGRLGERGAESQISLHAIANSLSAVSVIPFFSRRLVHICFMSVLLFHLFCFQPGLCCCCFCLAAVQSRRR